ncbi:MAG: GNAT family N-acetyltransferase [Firmicutes bacterium]|nr:GNAT family N-acetyltransferase [Bacillota bacterium]
MDPYEQCPIYETERFRLRLVAEEDAPDLLPCYANESASVRASSEHCTYGYGSRTLEELQGFIRSWLEAYRERGFVRFTILEKASGRAIGTIEMFAFPKKPGVLRIDLPASHETGDTIAELLRIADHFFEDFHCGVIVTKYFPAAEEALRARGYAPYPRRRGFQRDGYWAKKSG